MFYNNGLSVFGNLSAQIFGICPIGGLGGK
jgi:hypothetical protein